jgi:GNAT superfamily N-acetyltransferase
MHRAVDYETKGRFAEFARFIIHDGIRNVRATSEATPWACAGGRVSRIRSSHWAYRIARRVFKVAVADVFVLDLAQFAVKRPEQSDYEFRFLTVEEVLQAAADPATELDRSIAARLESCDNFCFGAFDHGRLVNYSWFALRQIEPEHSFGAGLIVPSDSIYLHTAFTLPDYRGRRLHQAAIHRAAAYFAGIGLHRLFAIIEIGNNPSLRSHRRLGCQKVGRFSLLAGRPLSWSCDCGVRPMKRFLATS